MQILKEISAHKTFRTHIRRLWLSTQVLSDQEYWSEIVLQADNTIRFDRYFGPSTEVPYSDLKDDEAKFYEEDLVSVLEPTLGNLRNANIFIDIGFANETTTKDPELSTSCCRPWGLNKLSNLLGIEQSRLLRTQ